MTIELALQLVIVPGIPAPFDYEHEQMKPICKKNLRNRGGLQAGFPL